MPENLDFTAIYGPRAHEPAVYSCDSPDELCPFCTKGYGAFAQCQRCERYNVPHVQWLEDWDDPLISRHEAENHCTACLDDLRALRRPKT